MWKYVLKRVLLAIVTVFIIVAITFFAMNAIPGGPFQKEKAPDPAVQRQLEERFHLDKPIWEQFFIYLGNMFHGDLGISLKNGRDIAQTISESFTISAKLGGASIVVALAFGLFLSLIHISTEHIYYPRLLMEFL